MPLLINIKRFRSISSENILVTSFNFITYNHEMRRCYNFYLTPVITAARAITQTCLCDDWILTLDITTNVFIFSDV